MATMEEILSAREQRAETQKRLLDEHNKTLICFTMNIPGEEKNSPLIRLAFAQGLGELLDALTGVIDCHAEDTAAGPEAYIVVDDEPKKVKKITCNLEEADAIGRLYDMDVISPTGEKLSRKARRSCILCGDSAAVCARSGKHSVEEARAVVDDILKNYAAELLAQAAVDSLLEEVRLTPKPGLVDMDNSGAHSDMDISLFEKSAASLFPYFKTAVLLGLESEQCMPALQSAGVVAEETMFRVTDGVNTHKGALYAFGLILAAIGSHISFDSEIFSTAASLATAGKIPDGVTHGNTVRLKYRRCGARHEAEEGFPNAISAYNVLCETENPYRALLWLMSSVADTNLLYRGGADGLIYVQELSKATQELDDEHLPDGLRAMDEKMKEKRLSPGGSADLLALGIFLKKTEDIWAE